MKLFDLVKQRRSVRSFDGRPLTTEDREKIEAFIKTIDDPFDKKIDWTFLSQSENRLSVPVITGCDTYIAGKMKKESDCELAFGYQFEQIVLYCTSIGVGTTWIAGTMDRKGFEETIGLKEDEVMPCISPLGYEAEKMSFRETMMRKGIKADTRLPFESLFFDEDFTVPLKKEKDEELTKLLELVRLSPSAVNKQPWRIVIKDGKVHFYEKSDKGYSDPDGYDIQKIDMGIALCHFVMGLKEMGKQGRIFLEEPDIEVPLNTFYIASVDYE